MAFHFTKLAIPDVVSVQPDRYPDKRGFFMEVFKDSIFREWGLTDRFVQISHTCSRKNVIRGLHYQMNPKPQGKLVRAVVGEVFDVAVDIRRGSPNFGKWVGQVLSAEKKNLLWIPVGFAHGYCVLTEDSEVAYYCTEEWAPDCERGIIWNDPEINIEWPSQEPIISEKDAQNQSLADADINYEYEK
ncbi:MAG: dTDP-4-dehydrorhamnose 3,5-epimerase [Candidatus Aminicenantes bacterium]|nr:dTDP-4-dehydrorhamnose 3,5-epimerase [Candidatus Aminicenantes bacterium]